MHFQAINPKEMHQMMQNLSIGPSWPPTSFHGLGNESSLMFKFVDDIYTVLPQAQHPLLLLVLLDTIPKYTVFGQEPNSSVLCSPLGNIGSSYVSCPSWTLKGSATEPFQQPRWPTGNMGIFASCVRMRISHRHSYQFFYYFVFLTWCKMELDWSCARAISTNEALAYICIHSTGPHLHKSCTQSCSNCIAHISQRDGKVPLRGVLVSLPKESTWSLQQWVTILPI